MQTKVCGTPVITPVTPVQVSQTTHQCLNNDNDNNNNTRMAYLCIIQYVIYEAWHVHASVSYK